MSTNVEGETITAEETERAYFTLQNLAKLHIYSFIFSYDAYMAQFHFQPTKLWWNFKVRRSSPK